MREMATKVQLVLVIKVNMDVCMKHKMIIQKLRTHISVFRKIILSTIV